MSETGRPVSVHVREEKSKNAGNSLNAMNKHRICP